MTEYNTVGEIIDFAIEREQEAHDFYIDLAGKMDRAWMKKVFEDFAGEELGHKKTLMEMKEGKRPFRKAEDVQDLKMADYLVDVVPEGGLDYQQALVLAMKKEKAAFRLYTDLAEVTEDPDIKALLLMMAQEEAKHKLRFELEYDDNFTD